jgi:hypothetical protein
MSRSIKRNLVLVAGAVALVGACSASEGHLFTTSSTGGSAGTPGSTSGTGGAATSSGNGIGGLNLTASVGTGVGGGGVVCNVTNPNDDMDGDGWTPNQGDCNDCDPNVNPGATDVLHLNDGGPPTWGDEDCDGIPGSPYTKPCDTGLALDSMDPNDAVKAVDLCLTTTLNPPTPKQRTWGVIGARWALPDGADPTMQLSGQQLTNYHLGHGLLSTFGPNVHVQDGVRMLGLSSGTARQPTDPGYQDVSGFDKGYTCGSPMGFPKESPACPGVITGQPHDGAGVELQIRVPTNATGFTFDFFFVTYEWPDWVCSMYNDFFVAILSPIPMGQTDGNISFDTLGNPVSVNNAFLQVCGCQGMGPPCIAGGKTFTCSLGDSQLVGTGFGQDTAGQDHGSTGWLTTKAPVKGGEIITMRWAVYDSGDGVLDTSTLVDNFQWIANGGTVTVGTDPIGTPK